MSGLYNIRLSVFLLRLYFSGITLQRTGWLFSATETSWFPTSRIINEKKHHNHVATAGTHLPLTAIQRSFWVLCTASCPAVTSNLQAPIPLRSPSVRPSLIQSIREWPGVKVTFFRPVKDSTWVRSFEPDVLSRFIIAAQQLWPWPLDLVWLHPSLKDLLWMLSVEL